MKALVSLILLLSSHAIWAHDLKVGDVVIYDNNYARVIEREDSDKYTMERFDSPRPVVKHVGRESLAVRSGCQNGLCADEIVFDLFSMEYSTVRGLALDGSFALESSKTPYSIRSNVNRNDIAKTIGCRTKAPKKSVLRISSLIGPT